jgi:subtilase family serine protease
MTRARSGLAADGLVAAVQTIDLLAAGQPRDVTFEDILLKQGKHQLVATADLAETVAETDEQNNALTVTLRHALRHRGARPPTTPCFGPCRRIEACL